MKNILLWIVLGVVIAGGAYFFLMQKPVSRTSEIEVSEPAPQTEENTMMHGEGASEHKEMLEPKGPTDSQPIPTSDYGYQRKIYHS